MYNDKVSDFKENKILKNTQGLNSLRVIITEIKMASNRFQN